jgi:hypothetical protein
MECEPLQRLKALDLTTFRLRAAYGAAGRINKHFTPKNRAARRNRLTDVSPKEECCRADQNPLRRTKLDDFVNCYFGRGDSPNRPRAVEVNRPYLSRHERVETDRFRSFTYEELTKGDP